MVTLMIGAVGIMTAGCSLWQQWLWWRQNDDYWWRGVVDNAFRLKQSYSTPRPVSTAMGDCLWAGKPFRCEACQLGRLSLLLSVGW